MPVSIKDLIEESLNHRAVNHPYLKALGSGELPDTEWALRDFAKHYYGYSLHFPRYLTTVISKLEVPAHRNSLLQNLTEESGIYEDEEYAELAAVGVRREHGRGKGRRCERMGDREGNARRRDQPSRRLGREPELVGPIRQVGR